MDSLSERVTILETDRLVLYELDERDTAFIFDLVNDRDFLRYIGDRRVRSHDDALRYITAGPRVMYEQYGHGLWLVTVKDSGESIGMCGLLKRDGLEDIDLGFAFLPQFRRQGFATEAAEGAIDYARSILHARRLVAIAQPDNARSIGLLERLGFVSEGLIQLSEDAEALQLMARDL